MNQKVLLIELTSRDGGLTTGGLGATYFVSNNAIGGISREFYQNVKKHYDKPENWKFQNKDDYSESRNRPEDVDVMWTFEPSVALQIFFDMMKNEKIDLVYQQRLLRDGGVT